MEEYLKTYYEKRNFAKTPEPRGFIEDIENTAFVVHRHDARRLHFDLRIAYGGRLACWAVPKGFSYEPTARHLAVHTEDHPIQYLGFEGMIPRGQYGAGPLNIWDVGTYEMVKAGSLEEALGKGEIKLRLSGRKLRGEWHLVRLKKGKDEWLIFKAKDAYRDGSWDALFSIDLSAQPDTGLPGSIVPMSPRGASHPFSDPQWGYEIHLEGMRAICVKDGKEYRFIPNRSHSPDEDFPAGRFPGISALAPERAVLDGVIAVTDDRGLSSKKNLERLIAGGESPPGLAYHAFDILNFEGYDVTALPYEKRKALLSLVTGGRIPFVDFIRGDGMLFSVEAKKAGVTEVLAKRLDSSYAQGASDSWKSIDCGKIEVPAGDGPGRITVPVKETVIITHPEKIFFPELNLAKQDLISYYREAGEYMLPYLKDRPVHVYRFPNGIHGASFYQKHLPGDDSGLLEFVDAGSVGEDLPYFMCNSGDALLHLVNLGTIDLHVWFSRKESLESPDWIAWDLDPKGAPLADVVKIAKDIGKLLRGIGLASFLKTSGKSGLHILAPVDPRYSYEQARMFAESVARIIAGEHKKIATIERSMEARGGRVYIDFLQNRRGQTLAVPYAVRPVPSATVSMPLEWEELDEGLSVGAFTLHTAAERLSLKGDLFAPVITLKQELEGAIEKLEEYYSKKTNH